MDWLDDGAGVDAEALRRDALARDATRRHAARHSAAFREGLASARGEEAYLQAGFDAGFDDASAPARLRGRVRGALQVAVALLDKGALRHAASDARALLVELIACLMGLRWPARDEGLGHEDARGVASGVVEGGAVEDEGPPRRVDGRGGAYKPVARSAAAAHVRELGGLLDDAEGAVRTLQAPPGSEEGARALAAVARIVMEAVTELKRAAEDAGEREPLAAAMD
jgi:hypothetical protein